MKKLISDIHDLLVFAHDILKWITDYSSENLILAVRFLTKIDINLRFVMTSEY